MTQHNPLLSARVQSIKESPTLAITARAAKLKQEGRDIIALGAGEPDFDTPDHIKVAAKDALDRGFTKYTAVTGTPELKRAIVNKFQQENGLTYHSDQIIVGVGGKQCIFNLAMAVLNPGDEVIIPAPYWVSYVDISMVAGARPVIIPCDIVQNFKLQPEQLEKAITRKTRLFLINSPSNPTGTVYNNAELLQLANVLRNHPHVLIATDDIYEHINLGHQDFSNILNVAPDLKDRTIVLNGVSKAYSMTGWRIGYAAGSQTIIHAMGILQSQSTSNPTSIAQVAAQAALEGGLDCVTPMLKAFRERHQYIVQALNVIPGIHCIPAGGAFYLFADAREAIAHLHAIGKLATPSDMAFSDYLLESAGVAVVPGSAFGAEGYFRVSFATSIENLRQAVQRIATICSV